MLGKHYIITEILLTPCAYGGLGDYQGIPYNSLWVAIGDYREFLPLPYGGQGDY